MLDTYIDVHVDGCIVITDIEMGSPPIRVYMEPGDYTCPSLHDYKWKLV